MAHRVRAPRHPLTRNESPFFHVGEIPLRADEATNLNLALKAPGETVVDLHALLVSGDLTAGTYVLVVGLYDSQTDARVSIVDSAGQTLADEQIILNEVEIK